MKIYLESFSFFRWIRASHCVKKAAVARRCCAAEDPSAEWIISWALKSPGLTSQVLSAARPLRFSLPSPAPPSKKAAPEGAAVSACSAGAPTTVRFMHHRFNKHRQHPHRSPLPILPAEGTKLFPLLSSPPNPRLYQLSIKKIQLQFGIRQNTLITKGWCNLITWYLFRGLSRGLTHIERGWKGKRKKAMQGKCQNKPSLLCCEGHICWMAFLHNLTEPVCACAEERRGGGISVRAFAGPLTARTSDVVEIKNG